MDNDFIEKIEFLKGRFKENGLYEQYLSNFLTAKKGNIELTEDMLRTHVAWKKKQQERQPVEDFELLQDCISHGVIGQDKSCNPVLWVIVRDVNESSLKEVGSNEIIVGYFGRMLHKLYADFTKSNNEEKLTVVVKVQVSEIDSNAQELIRDMAIEFQANLPEMLNRIIVLSNENMRNVFDKLKSYLEKDTKTKVNFIEEESELSKYIEKSLILEEFGGELDEDWLSKREKRHALTNETDSVGELKEMISNNLKIGVQTEKYTPEKKQMIVDMTPLNTQEADEDEGEFDCEFKD